MDDCIFCKIAKGEIPAKIIAENEKAIAFEDISPVAPVHVLIIPKEHIPNVMWLDERHGECIESIFRLVQVVAREKEIDSEEKGFRLITNYGEDGGQTVKHLHFHLIGGKSFGPKIIHD